MLISKQTNAGFNNLHLIICQILNLRTLWIFLKKYTTKPYPFLVMDCTLCQIIVTFQRKTFRKNIKTIKTIYENIRYEKLQNDINREAAIISSLSSGEIEKYEYLSGK